ncbi:MAG: 2,3-bisphosphoglycerate-independent phosphoglycerate mutase [Candidatus Babeliales bacterium]|jgi:2,3-bisphosphoglycerate-independent phosphoglycerate mutase
MNTPTMLIILDGFGYRAEREGNAIAQAAMPFWNSLCTHYPSALLNASGPDVGLLPGYVGNSEVGHLTIGSGRVVTSLLKKFHDAIQNESFFSNELLIKRFEQLKQTGKTLHLMGLVSDAGVHGHQEHLHALIKLAHRCGLTNVVVHAFLDGRDTPPRSAGRYLEQLSVFCSNLGCGSIASIQGRFYAMDRDKNWARTQQAYDMLCGITPPIEHQAHWHTLIDQSYQAGIYDEFIPPIMLIPQATIKPGDGIVFFNFRPDRARQLTNAFINPFFEYFKNPLNTGNKTLAFFITTTRYDEKFAAFSNDILFEPEHVEHTLLDEIAAQVSHPNVFLIAETEKYAHITYFFRGMRETHLSHETRALIPSIKAKSYAQTPAMAAPLITSTLIESLHQSPQTFYLVNYANADMVGHSGDFDATIKACQVLDRQLSCLYHEVVEHCSGTLFITADHGNVEEKIDSQGNALTAHTCNPVPFIVVHKETQRTATTPPFSHQPVFGLAHIAPTILASLHLRIPSCMEQETIVVE